MNYQKKRPNLVGAYKEPELLERYESALRKIDAVLREIDIEMLLIETRLNCDNH